MQKIKGRTLEDKLTKNRIRWYVHILRVDNTQERDRD
jgi:hypothetical protein